MPNANSYRKFFIARLKSGLSMLDELFRMMGAKTGKAMPQPNESIKMVKNRARTVYFWLDIVIISKHFLK